MSQENVFVLFEGEYLTLKADCTDLIKPLPLVEWDTDAIEKITVKDLRSLITEINTVLISFNQNFHREKSEPIILPPVPNDSSEFAENLRNVLLNDLDEEAKNGLG